MLSLILGPSPAPRPPRSPWPGSSSRGSPWPFYRPPPTQWLPILPQDPRRQAWAPGRPPTSPATTCTFPGPRAPLQRCDPSAGPQALRGPPGIFPEFPSARGPPVPYLGRTLNPHIGPTGRLDGPREGHMALCATQSPSELPIPTKGSPPPRCLPGPPQWDPWPLHQGPPHRGPRAYHVAGGSEVL